MSILVKPDTKVLVQGITGSFGARHAQLSIDYGTQVVAGVTPGKGGQVFEHGGKKVPIFDTAAEAVKQTGATASAVFVPAAFAADAILEGADAGLELVVAITEGIPVRDMIRVKRALQGRATRLIGPNCPGIVTPGEGKDSHGGCRIGIAPGYIATENTKALREDPVRNKTILDRIPEGRWGAAEDIAGGCVFLASGDSDYLNGAVLNIDGGWLGR